MCNGQFSTKECDCKTSCPYDLDQFKMVKNAIDAHLFSKLTPEQLSLLQNVIKICSDSQMISHKKYKYYSHDDFFRSVGLNDHMIHWKF